MNMTLENNLFNTTQNDNQIMYKKRNMIFIHLLD